ncbi:hypothetical protein PPTG_04749 [Phytophthora nicotianae INRA-310]|uniref:Uncharacterized protein n=1 Tax=Phytophthora nicotianae (strain INRA-310) TaxID=761204 RepID=W2R1X3_PHYN3|nr:hypothetical protein PPTG_04749 [Phytophthora nicotianae INRA-310]ETN19432.1 hypothetical protein PPTG_04749 [Phytophthora nicotianae INRA-310]
MQEELLLDETARLDDDNYLRMNFQPGDRDIHVLVECPDESDQVVRALFCPFNRYDFDAALLDHVRICWLARGELVLALVFSGEGETCLGYAIFIMLMSCWYH